jgi:uncharacterized protein (TIGR02246 family)
MNESRIEKVEVIDRLVEAYNSGNARAFADLFQKEAIAYEHPNQISQNGREEIYKRYVDVFAQFPKNHSKILYRVVIKNRVIDHELVSRTPQDEPFQVIAIYEIENGLINRFDIVR